MQHFASIHMMMHVQLTSAAHANTMKSNKLKNTREAAVTVIKLIEFSADCRQWWVDVCGVRIFLIQCLSVETVVRPC